MCRAAIVKFSDRVNMDWVTSKWIEVVERRKLAAFWSVTVAAVSMFVQWALHAFPKQEETFSSLMTLRRTRMATPADNPGAVGAVFKRCKPLCLHNFCLANRKRRSGPLRRKFGNRTGLVVFAAHTFR